MRCRVVNNSLVSVGHHSTLFLSLPLLFGSWHLARCADFKASCVKKRSKGYSCAGFTNLS
jgi:hypothetical protein